MNQNEREEKTVKNRPGVLLALLIGVVIIGGAYAFFTAVFTDVEDDTTITIGAGRLGLHMDDGNIRMIYNGTCPDNDCTINGATGGASATIGSSAFNTQFNHNRFVGYMFGEAAGDFNAQHANTNSSTIKTFVDNWFNNDANISAPARSMVANNTVFCIDRTIGSQAAHASWSGGSPNANSGMGTTVTAFGVIDRLM